MKSFLSFISILLGLSLISTPLEARGNRGGGKAKSSASNRSVKRSPMTGSKMQRPASRPAPKPTSRPKPAASKPVSRPKPTPKPVERPSVQKPASRPDKKPASRPDKKPELNRPGKKPELNRPDKKPELNRPDKKPELNRPGKKPELNRPDKKPELNRPDKKPELNRPGKKPELNRPASRPDRKPMPSVERPKENRPATLPGMVSYPKKPGNNKPDRPKLDNRPGNNNGIGNGNNRGNRVNIDNSRNRNKIDNSRNVHIDKVNVNKRNTALNRPGTRPVGRRDWDDKKWGGNRGVWGKNVNIQNNVKINNNFRHNNNFSYRPNYWGGRPWWGANQYHGWHHGHWNYGWNSNYYHRHWYYNDDNFASGFMWGIAVWSLGNMVYDMGYNTYRNPYPAPPVENTYITYTQPVSVAAAANPPGDETVEETAITKSSDALVKSRDAFKAGDYVTALKACDEAISYAPGDTTLHEYRALVYFALGKYSDAAGIMNPVLASGPGWGWDTMIGFYDSSSTYDEQLRKLEAYVKGKPDGADGHFLLGYHYMVCGHMEQSYEQFETVVKLQPADSIAVQLRNLTKSSLPDAGEDATPEQEAPEPVPTEKLVGNWVASPSGGGKITFKMEESGDFIWSFVNGDQTSELKGTYGLDEQGLLVLTTEDTQMVSVVSLPQDSELKFTLVGSPDGDPGLDFKKG